MGRLYIQKSSSTPLLHGFVYTSLELLLPSTWQRKQIGHGMYLSNFGLCLKILTPWIFYCFIIVPYLIPLLMVSVGVQLTVSTQSVQWYCLLSRNQPESERPRTCIPVCPRPSSSSDTRSTFRRTPVPPALCTESWLILISTHTTVQIRPQILSLKPNHMDLPASC